MTTYTPDRWVLLEITNQETGDSVQKVFAGWYGGYAGSDTWKLSSGVVATEDRDDYIEFLNSSGSVYKCYKNSLGMSGYMGSVYSSWIKEAEKTGAATFAVLNVS